MKAFSKLISETNDLAGQRELVAEYLQVDVMEPLKVLARDVAAERRKYLNEGAELLRQLKVSMETLERVRQGEEDMEGKEGGGRERGGGEEKGIQDKGKERGERMEGRECLRISLVFLFVRNSHSVPLPPPPIFHSIIWT